jgi:hypothetical protein
LLEEPPGRPRVTPWGDEDVDDLPELIDRPIDIAPLAGDLHIGLVDVPAVPNGVPARPGGVGQQRGEPLHPPIHADVVDLDAALGEQFLDISVGQAEAEVPPHRQDDHLGWEPEAGERGRRCRSGAGMAGVHGRQSCCSVVA